MSFKMRKPLKIALIFVTGILIMIFSSASIRYYINQKSIKSHTYLKNEYGETYGSAADVNYNGGKEPDLIIAVGTDGKTVGYVRSSDLNDFQPKNPKEALEYMAKHKGYRIIPLYDYNGKKVIGEFRIGSPSN